MIDDYKTRGLPFALYFRKFGVTVMHGPMEYGARLTENVLRDAMPSGVNLLTIQSHSATPEYSGSGSTFNRSAPALLVDDADWQQVAMSLIPFADLIVSEAYMLGPGVRFELDTAFQAARWDRTVLLLPALKDYVAVIDNDPLIQLFPRVIWIDDFHTESLMDSALVKDLIARMARIAALDDTERLRLADRAARDEAFPVDLRPIAAHYEFEARWESQRQDEDDRVRYYCFWKLFRAAHLLFLKSTGSSIEVAKITRPSIAEGSEEFVSVWSSSNPSCISRLSRASTAPNLRPLQPSSCSKCLLVPRISEYICSRYPSKLPLLSERLGTYLSVSSPSKTTWKLEPS